jgi:hypothetical protein
MFTTSFWVKDNTDEEKVKESAMKQWRIEFGTCELTTVILQQVNGLAQVELTCENEKHDHMEGMID